MKIIGGKYWNKKLVSANKKTTRPSLGRARESLFHVLDNYFYFENKTGCDLFAGSGSLGLEALSRNLSFCYFNDYDKAALSSLGQNIKHLDIPSDKCEISNLFYSDFLTKLRSMKIKLDLIFIDPPHQETNYYHEAVNKIIDWELLNENGIIILEANSKETSLENINSRLTLLTSKKYGRILLYFYRYEKKG